MPTKSLLTAAVALCLLASCKKNDGSNSPGSANANNLKLYVEETHVGSYNETDSFAVAYDKDGRITSLASPKLKFQYAYQANTSFTLDLYENGALSIHETAFINGKLHVDSTFQFNDTQDTTTEKFAYNGDLLTSQTTYDYASGVAAIFRRETYTYDNNSNVIKDVQNDGAGHINQITTYTYTDKPLQVTVNPTYYPVQSKYLPATSTVTDGAGNKIGTITYTYVFDSSGRVTKETDKQDNGQYVIKSYIYS